MSKFKNYLNLVQEHALKQKKKFFLDCREGRTFEKDDMEGADLSGWLIPLSDADEFFEKYHAEEGVDKWLDHMVFAIWKENERGIMVEFRAY